MIRPVLLAVFATALLAGCSWVDLKPGADRVNLRSSSQVHSCERLGATTTSVRDRVGFYNRNSDKVGEELADLARNSALELGGDTIVPDGPIDDGERRFIIYRCLR